MENPASSQWLETLSYLAPSRQACGWGVFASRSFRKGDIVEVAPMFLRVDYEENRIKVLKETVLNNYHYEYWGWDASFGRWCCYSMISTGMTLYYNHSSNQANIEQRKLGREPDFDNPDDAAAIIYFALRDIKEGEELLVDYGGSEWFIQRGIVLMEPDLTAPCELESPEPNQSEFVVNSSKSYSRYDIRTFQRVIQTHERISSDEEPFRVESIIPFLSSDKSGFGSVISKVSIGEGETIDFIPVLILTRKMVEGTILEALALSWDDVGVAANCSLEEVVEIEYRPDSDENGSSTMVPTPRNDTVLFPLAGNVSMFARSLSEANARLIVEADQCNADSYCLRVVAEKWIHSREAIVLRVKQLSSDAGIRQELALSGQPVSL